MATIAFSTVAVLAATFSSSTTAFQQAPAFFFAKIQDRMPIPRQSIEKVSTSMSYLDSLGNGVESDDGIMSKKGPSPASYLDSISEASPLAEDEEVTPIVKEDKITPEPVVAEAPVEEPKEEPVEAPMLVAPPTPAVVITPEPPAVATAASSEPSSLPEPVVEKDKQVRALVPINEETVEFTAGVIGGAVGFAVAGPVGGVVGAAVGNFVSKQENDGDNDFVEAVQGISMSTIQLFNYLSKLEAKYEVLDKTKSSLENALVQLKSQEGVDSATVEQVEAALSKTTAKIGELSEEYDVWSASLNALDVVGSLVEKSVTKLGSLSQEYEVVDKMKGLFADATKTAQAAVEAASSMNEETMVEKPTTTETTPITLTSEPAPVLEEVTTGDESVSAATSSDLDFQ